MAIKGTVYIKSDPQQVNDQSKSEIAVKKGKEKAKKEIKKLNTLAEETESVIYQLSSVFPFQIFPDKIIIDKNKVTIVRKELFFKRIFPMLVEDITTVKVSRGIFFASMEFELKGYERNPRPTTHFWPEHASKAEHYILGLIKAKRDKVDLTKLTTIQVRKRLEGIGSAEEEFETLF